MNSKAPRDRFDELDAARALGDLSPDEARELSQLEKESGFEMDSRLDWIVAGLEACYEKPGVDLKESVKEKMKNQAENLVSAEKVLDVPFWKRPQLGWAVAACLAVMLWFQGRPVQDSVEFAKARGELLGIESHVQLPFSGAGDFAEVSGDVVWSDERQEGYMRLNGLVANRPSERQYQLWIVDPERDSAPVDGGVFDILSSEGDTIVPVRATLPVDQPVAFVITVEQPGGVVVSKQEVVAAIAQRG